jgi:hypothetical protein
MKLTTHQTGALETLRIDHADGGCTVIVDAPEYAAVVTFDAPTLKRFCDKRLIRRATSNPETPHVG